MKYIALAPILAIFALTACNVNSFRFDDSTTLAVNDAELQPIAQTFSEHINRLTGTKIEMLSSEEPEQVIRLTIDEELTEIDYAIKIGDQVEISAPDKRGIAFGLADLIQDIEIKGQKVVIKKGEKEVDATYDYRTVMIDLARFWHPVTTIKETIDLLWYYQIPYLQLHLSDNRRFTFPMDEYPALKRVLPNGRREFYTREELLDLVEYADDRGIAIIPEIDLPGHSSQLWTQYPDIFGHVDPKTGNPTATYVVNIAKESCYTGCRGIINELAEVFHTSPFIHFGSDEVYLEVIKTLPGYKTFCLDHGLEAAAEGNVQELFCYFINQMNSYVKEAGKKSIVWEGFHGNGAGSIEVDKDIKVIVWNTTYNHPQTLLDHGFTIMNSTWMPWYMVSAMNFAPSPERAHAWEITEWDHWNEKIEPVKLDSKEGIWGAQICFWEQNYFRVIPILSERLPIFSEKLLSGSSPASFEEASATYQAQQDRFNELFHHITFNPSGLLHTEDLTFTDSIKITLEASTEGEIRVTLGDGWGLPRYDQTVPYSETFSLYKSAVLTAQVYDSENNPIGYPQQKYYQKITPIYKYEVFGSAPITGWVTLPDFDTLPQIRSGYMGKMNQERLKMINAELFAKVNHRGHIDTRFADLYNPYGVELTGLLTIPKSDSYTFFIQTWDGLASLSIDGELIGSGTATENTSEAFAVDLDPGAHTFTIRYYYRHIQNQLAIEYAIASSPGVKKPFESLVAPMKITD